MIVLYIISILFYLIQIPLCWIGVLWMKKKDKDLWSIMDYFKLLMFSFVPLLNIAGLAVIIEEGGLNWLTKKKY